MPPPIRRLVGRDAELEQLCDRLGISAPGHRGSHQAVVLAGDAGVGKTRLLSELVERARAAGWQVVVGHCLDFGESALPYLPFSEVVGRLVGEAPEVVATVSDRHPGLARLRPGRRMIQDEDDPGQVTLDRGDLFEAVQVLLEEVARRGPLLVVVEDTHWADRSTRDLISFLFSRGFDHPVSLVASYRSDDLHRRHPLRRSVAEWGRIPGVDRIALAPLAPDAVRALVQQLHPEPLDVTEVEQIVARAEGNAFFVEELVGAGQAVPDDLAELLLLRLDRLGEEARQVVRAASVAGRRVSHQLLAAVVDLPELEEAVREAVESHVLVPTRDDRYSFRHALLAEAVHDDLLPGERVRLHEAFVKVLQSRTAPGTAAELALHARAAGDLDTALHASIEAGEDALGVGGPDEAAQHLQAALEILARTPAPEVDPGVLASRAANALILAGRPRRALDLLVDQIKQLPADAAEITRAELHAAMAATILVCDTRLDPLEHTTAALALTADEPSVLRVRVLNFHARSLAVHRREDEAREAATEAIAMAESLDLHKIATDAMATLARMSDDHDADVTATLEEVVRRAAASGDFAPELRGRYLLALHHQDRGEFAQARRVYAENFRRAEEAGARWAPYGFDARVMDAQVGYLTGDWDGVLASTDIRDPGMPSTARAMVDAWRMMVHAGRGEVEETRRLRERSRPVWCNDGLIVITGGAAMIDALGDVGDADAMLAAYDETVAEISRLWRKRSRVGMRLAALAVGQLARGADRQPVAERERRAEAVARIGAAAAGVTDLLREEGAEWGPEGTAWAARLAAEELRFRWLAGIDAPSLDDLVAAWTESVRAFDDFSHAFETARSRTRLAAVYRAAGDLSAARAVADLARETAERLGAQPLLDEIAALGTTPVAAPASAPTALTPREAEVLALVAEGRTNGEIGRQLFISTKTVSVHVSNLLAKLGAASRTEAAAIARRDGLLPG